MKKNAKKFSLVVAALSLSAAGICFSNSPKFQYRSSSVNAEACSHTHVEHYDGISPNGGTGYVEHWACCECHSAWADEARTISLGDTISARTKIDISGMYLTANHIGSGENEWTLPMEPIYDASIEAVAYEFTNINVTGVEKLWIETQGGTEISEIEYVTMNFYNGTNGDLNLRKRARQWGAADSPVTFAKDTWLEVKIFGDYWNHDANKGAAFDFWREDVGQITGYLRATAPVVHSYQADIDNVISLINGLPSADEYTLPDQVYVVNDIKAADAAYKSLPESCKSYVTNYSKLSANIDKIGTYSAYQVMTAESSHATAIPNYHYAFPATTAGTLSYGTDYVGNYVQVVSDEDSTSALLFTNLSGYTAFTHVYIYVQVSVGCEVYFSDGIENDGWGKNYKNTWDDTNLWCNENTWKLVELDVSRGIISSDFAIGFKTSERGITIKVSTFYGISPTKMETSYSFGQRTATQETYPGFGTVYDLIQEQWFIDNPDPATMASAQPNALANALPLGKTELQFAIFNPNESAVNFHVGGGSPWGDGPTTSLAPQAWTVVTITQTDIKLNQSGTVYYYIGSSNTPGWKVTAIFAI